jgi:dihydrofolate synthase/folylpolyglutamate synthase
MTYAAAIEFLSSLGVFGARPGLGEHPAPGGHARKPATDKLRFIHVAGTNGKGSTCAMLEGIYRAAGLRVGLFTSPHLVSFTERMQVNRVPASEDDVVRLVREIQPLLQKFPAESHPTFFEVVTAMALRQFADRQLRSGDMGNGPGRTARRDQHRDSAGQRDHQHRSGPPAMAG